MKDKRQDITEQEQHDNGAEQVEKSENIAENGDTTPATNTAPDEVAEQIQAAKQQYLYLLADFENFKRNAAKERIELQQTAGRDIVAELLPILDDFDRAAKSGALDEGTVLIHQKLLHVLQTKGLRLIETEIGDAFNADLHDAVAEIPAPQEEQKGKIIDILEKGYQFGGRIIRYAKVVVGC
ncbi:MAG: nucleotide exchange factor GrpE [Saprospiraceae bacterium]|nr:nucleotide exchange factor GrpE [Saprospiraceae bacterium]